MTAIRVARRERYTAIDRRTINDESLSFRARGILVWLLDKPDDWRVDSEQIAVAAKEGRDAVRTALNELVAAGYIVRHKEQDEKGRWISSTWVYERPPDDWKPDVGSSDVGEPGAIPKTETDDCDKEEPSVPLPPTPRKRGEVDEAFEAWWKLYPKKAAGKGQAREKWRKMTKADREAAVEAIGRHVDWWTEHATDEQFIPAGNVWLNQRRWEDEQPRARTVSDTVVTRPSRLERLRAMRQTETETGT